MNKRDDVIRDPKQRIQRTEAKERYLVRRAAALLHTTGMQWDCGISI